MKNRTGILFAVSIFILFVSCSQRNSSISSKTWQCLGTVCSVSLYQDGTESLYNSIYSELLNLEYKFSTSLDKSRLYNMNLESSQKDCTFSLDQDFCELLNYALYFAKTSDGIFDPTIAPLVNLWNINSASPEVPDEALIQQELLKVDYSKLILEGNELFVPKGFSMELGGIAKGYAADKIVEILKENNVKKALINLGGNIYVYGSKGDKSKWKVGIKDPIDTNEIALVLETEGNMSVVTSGVYERNFTENNVLYHHILDSLTGYPAWSTASPKSDSKIVSSSIICPSSTVADALSTISFIMGPRKFMEYLPQIQQNFNMDIQFIFITENREIFCNTTSGINSISPAFSLHTF